MESTNLFSLSEKEYQLERRVYKLREAVRQRSEELSITTDHSVEGHFYVRDGQRYPSVTGKLQILKDPGLANWKMNRALDYVFQNYQAFSEDNIMEHVSLAKMLPQTEFEQAGSIGSTVHDWREEWFQHLIAGRSQALPPPPASDPRVLSCCRAIQKFVSDTNYLPVACELKLADHDLQLGGMLDDLGFVRGELALVDLKTSNQGAKNSYFYQVALYAYMFTKLYGIRPKKFYILHTSKVDGSYDLIELKDMSKLKKEALLILKLSTALDRLEESKRPDRVII